MLSLCENPANATFASIRPWGRAFVAESVEWIRRNENPDFELPYPIETVREYGWKPEQLAQQKEHMVHELATMREALALGDISAVEDDVSLVLSDFQISLDRKSASYRELGTLALQAYVRALEAIEKRNAGEVVATPKLDRGALSTQAAGGGTLRDAFEGWKLERAPSAGTLYEYERAVELFIQLHGDLALTAIKKSHARTFREALQVVPRKRNGKLLKATFSEYAPGTIPFPARKSATIKLIHYPASVVGQIDCGRIAAWK